MYVFTYPVVLVLVELEISRATETCLSTLQIVVCSNPPLPEPQKTLSTLKKMPSIQGCPLLLMRECWKAGLSFFKFFGIDLLVGRFVHAWKFSDYLILLKRVLLTNKINKEVLLAKTLPC